MTPEELAGEIRKALVSNKGDGRNSYSAEDVAEWLLGRYRLESTVAPRQKKIIAASLRKAASDYLSTAVRDRPTDEDVAAARALNDAADELDPWGGALNDDGLWEPTIHDRFDLKNGSTIFVVTCGPDFNRKIGSRVKLVGEVWEVLGWDDHRTMGGPHDGENIALKVQRVASHG